MIISSVNKNTNLDDYSFGLIEEIKKPKVKVKMLMKGLSSKYTRNIDVNKK